MNTTSRLKGKVFLTAWSLFATLTAQNTQSQVKSGMLAQQSSVMKKAEAGDVMAQCKINQLLMELGESPIYSYQKIIGAMEKQAKDGDPEKVYRLAVLVGSEYPGIKTDRSRRKFLIAQVAKLGHPQAMIEHARDLWEDEKDGEQALNWWLRGRETLIRKAEAGDKEAMSQLWYLSPPAGLQDHGRVRELDLFKDGTKWLRLSAEIGDADAMFNLGLRLTQGSIALAKGESAQESIEREGVEWLKKAAGKGHWEAMVHLGRIYAFGLPCEVRFVQKGGLPDPTDPTKAWYWWDKAIALVGEEKVMELVDPGSEGNFPPRTRK